MNGKMEPLLVKVILKGEDVDKFCAIQRKHGVLHKSEVIRICVNNCYDELCKEKNPKEAAPS